MTNRSTDKTICCLFHTRLYDIDSEFLVGAEDCIYEENTAFKLFLS